ncbi:hypothetical protein [Burkholderia arboris]|uniref:hypothetical protein n=1 Tax=Burkholderia arboris TaxID=488730 RepID=UPI0030F2EE14
MASSPGTGWIAALETPLWIGTAGKRDVRADGSNDTNAVFDCLAGMRIARLRARRISASRPFTTTADINTTIHFLSDVNRRDETLLPIVSLPDIQTALLKSIQPHILPIQRVIIATGLSIQY